MEPKHILLKLAVQALGVEGSIERFQDRKDFQKAIYLGQRAGVDLGYRFSWYIKGPYSTSLARDYYALEEHEKQGDATYTEYTLNKNISEKLQRISDLFNPPAECELNKSSWMELLASWHYLLTIHPKDKEQAREIMLSKKPNLYDFVEKAEERLKKHNLL